MGYLLKSHAGHELLPAMTEVAGGRRFISAVLTGHADNARGAPRCHEVGFYEDGAALLDAFVRFAEWALREGKSLIVVLDQPRRRTFRERLQAKGLDVQRAASEGRYFALDPADVLSRVLVDGWPDETLFWSSATALMAEASRASQGRPPLVAVCGMGTACLLRDGSADAAVRLEDLWSEVATAYNVDMLCGFSMDLFGGEEYADALGRIRAQHSTVHAT
jgi:hypothetical protein